MIKKGAGWHHELCRFSWVIGGLRVFQPTPLPARPYLFTHSWNVKQFCLTYWLDLIMCYHSEPEWTWGRLQRSGPSRFPKLRDCSLTIKLFSVISRSLVGGGLTSLQRCSRCSLQPPHSRLGHRTLMRGVLPLCRDAGGVLCSPSRLDRESLMVIQFQILLYIYYNS